MKIKFYVLHCDLSVYTCFLIDKDPKINSYLIQKSSQKITESRCFNVTCYGFYYILNELSIKGTFYKSLATFIKSSNLPYVIKIHPNHKEHIDKTWGEIVRVLVWEQLEIDHMMSWLSTLGGAFSALGDYFQKQSEIAGKISMQQMKLAMRLGDPSIISRCLLYLSISLIQKHKFKLAKRIVRSQFEFANQNDDVRLRKMCLGIWSKLQYTHLITKKIGNKTN